MVLLTFFTKILHFFSSEISHHLALKGLHALYLLGILKFFIQINDTPSLEDHASGIKKLKNKLGIAAGLDKNGDYIDSLSALGIGFLEIGTVTPLPQNGNPKPRLFRNIEEKSLLNRMGFNNKGLDHVVKKLQDKKSNIAIGTSIGKNFNTKLEDAHKDYLVCLDRVYEYSDYIAVNISSPNTKDLRKLSSQDYLNDLLMQLSKKQKELSSIFGFKPLFVKISPDENDESLEIICKTIMEHKLNGIICSNTTVDHEDKNGEGGLSGVPLRKRSNQKLILIKKIVGDKLPVIASGGVMSPEDYNEKLKIGADLVQVYSGFIFEGPKLIRDITNQNTI